MLRKNPFIPPALPVLRREPPAGSGWLHEVKYDGWRAQLHLVNDAVTIYGKNGGDLTLRFRSIATALAALPFESLILDAELVACDPDGTPNFYAMMRGAKDGCCAYCFDLLSLDGHSRLAVPLEERRGLLRRVMRRAPRDTMRLSEAFQDPLELLAVCEKHGLEGIVSKRRDAPYVSGTRGGWVKVKTATWRAANRERYKLFEKG